jgi:hypothetical protein
MTDKINPECIKSAAEIASNYGIKLEERSSTFFNKMLASFGVPNKPILTIDGRPFSVTSPALLGVIADLQASGCTINNRIEVEPFMKTALPLTPPQNIARNMPPSGRGG